jgi:predicted CoA-substrate-specific enzyme activase
MNVRYAGIDIGSRSIELVVINDGNIVESRQADSGVDPMNQAQKLLDGLQYDSIMATGYGRNLFELSFDAPTVTEIKAHARGATYLIPGTRTVLDIGGQDSKAIAIGENGRVLKFEMNDRCAAGTGKFLEIMSHTLGYRLEEFGIEALKATKDIQISSMCTVFAESEVTSLVSKGEQPREIALGLHRSVVRRASGMINRVGAKTPVVFSGGVAHNPCIHRLLEDAMQTEIQVPENPHMVGALGAALLAADG